MPEGPLRVALVTDWYPPGVGGVETQVHGLAGALAARGHDVRVVTTSRDGAASPGPDGVRVDRLACAHLPRTRIATPTRATYEALCDRLADAKPDVVHAHGLFSTLAMGGVLAARRLGIASVATHHSLLRLHHLPAARLVYRLASGHADLVTAVSEAAARHARLASGRDDVLTLPNGIDLARLRHVAPAAPPNGEIRVAGVMRLKLRKRPYELLWSFARALSRVAEPSRVRLILVGDGPERGRLERLAAWLGIGHRVEFHGDQAPDQVARTLAGASLFVSAARTEAFGLAMLEARAAGLPIVAMSGGGVADLVDHDRNGLVASSRRAFADAIARVVDDEGLRRRLAEGSREGIERFSWDALARRYVGAYRLAVERRRGAAEAAA